MRPVAATYTTIKSSGESEMAKVVKGQITSPEEALQQLREIMRKLKLTVNEEKTRICKVPEPGGKVFENQSNSGGNLSKAAVVAQAVLGRGGDKSAGAEAARATRVFRDQLIGRRK
jgi:hypothetical protein